ncbi:MAG TPA: hypothetical protein DDZ89_04325 [Clostridiales bacterium]|nr:hypothetical protein [Clostridiales bacterium]
MRKILCLLVVMALVVSFVACAKNGEEQPNVTTGSTTTTEETTEANPFEEFFEITWLTQLNADWQEERWDELELEERFNVDLQVWAEDGRNAERMAALVAAGEIPDYFFAPGLPKDPYGMYADGLTRSITLQQMKDWIPEYVEAMEKLPIGFSYNLVPGTTDEYLGFTHNNLSGSQYFYDATIVNLDWLEAVGYGIDEDKMQEYSFVGENEPLRGQLYIADGDFTFDDFNEILRAFTEDDPDGNGIDDTFGMLYLIESAWTNMTQEGLFGVCHDLNYLYKDPVTGDVVPKYGYTPYRDYLAWVSDNLAKGFMKQRPGVEGWVVEYQQMSLTNKYGIYGGHGGVGSAYPPLNILKTVDANSRFVMGPLFSGPNGVKTDITYNIDPYGTGNYRVIFIGEQVDDAKLERICSILRYTTYSSQENWTRYKYGIEGIHFNWEGEKFISTRVGVPVADLAPEYRGQLNVFGLWHYPSVVQQQIDYAELTDTWTYMPYMHANNLFEKYALNPAKYTSEAYMGREMYAEFVTDRAETNTELNPIINDFKTRALAGEIANYNTEWTEYIDSLYANGLQTMIDKYYNNPDFKEYDPGEKFTIRE